MKPQTGIAISALIFAGAFLIYSNLPSQTNPRVPIGPESGLQANVSKSLEREKSLPEQNVEEEKEEGVEREIDLESTSGLSEELEGILGGFNEITEELESLEGTSTLAQ